MNPAFAYLYDEFVHEPEHRKELDEVEAAMANRSIGGRMIRMGMFRQAKEMVAEVVRSGAQNLVIVGNDATLSKMIFHAPDLGATVGYVPIGEGSRISTMLGISRGQAAVDVLAARLIENLDIGRVAGRFFLTEVSVSNPLASLSIEGRFSVSAPPGGTMIVRNLGLPESSGQASADPKDGQLELVVEQPELPKRGFWRQAESENRSKTHLFFREGLLAGDKVIQVSVDGQLLEGVDFPISIEPGRLRFITGRRRLFANH